MSEERSARFKHGPSATVALCLFAIVGIGLIWAFTEFQNRQPNVIQVPTWRYSSDHDSMRNEDWFFANLTSNDGPSNRDGSVASLDMQIQKKKDSEMPNNLIPVLILSDGQFDCGIRGCNVDIRADNADIQTIEAKERRCGSEACLDLLGDGLIDLLRSTKKLTIEVPLFDNGKYQFHFHTEGLKWSESTNRQ